MSHTKKAPSRSSHATAHHKASHAKLSADQRRLLANLLRYYRHVEAHGSDRDRIYLRLHGVPMSWLRPRGGSHPSRTRADTAAFSRAVRRLEARGLVLRVNSTTGQTAGPRAGKVRRSADEPFTGRTDHILLTDAGRQAAETVSTDQVVNANRF
jgi:hypothetical protein